MRKTILGKTVVGLIWFIIFYYGSVFTVGVLFTKPQEFEVTLDHTNSYVKPESETFLGGLLLYASATIAAFGTIAGVLPGTTIQNGVRKRR